MADDQFGIKQIYPTRTGGRTWFLRDSPEDIMEDPRIYGDLEDEVEEDGNPTDGFTIEDEGQVRCSVAPVTGIAGKGDPDVNQDTVKGRGYIWSINDWDIRGIEMTARVKCTNTGGQTDGVIFTMKGPTGDHSGSPNCSGSSYSSRFYMDPSGSNAGKVQFTKEQWHVHYEDRSEVQSGLGSFFNKWVVFKYIIFIVKSSDNSENFVKIEQWVNTNNDGHTFVRANVTVDAGGWSDGDGALTCDADRADEIMDWDGPIMIYRWDGPHIIFKDLSIREIDPSGQQSGEPPQPPSTGTISRDYTFKYNLGSFAIDSCGVGQETPFTEFYNVDDTGSASNLHRERYRVGVLANGASSQVVGKKPRSVTVLLSKTGNPPSGDITCVLRKGTDDSVVVTFSYTGGTLNATALGTSKASYTFENLTANYVWQDGDRLTIEYSGNTVNVADEVNVFRNTSNPFDGTFTCAIKFDSPEAGTSFPPIGYTGPDVSRDYAWIIKE